MNYKNLFPILYKKDICYLDSAATSQKPKYVIEESYEYYRKFNSNTHRGAYTLSVEATEKFEEARKKVAKLINCDDETQIIFSKNATESLNLIAYSYGLENINAEDEIILSIMEHHSNLVPWQKVAKVKNAKLNYLYINNEYEITDEEIKSKITKNTKIVGITCVSNVLGIRVDVKKIIDYAHKMKAVVVLDATQAIPHSFVDVKELNADFVVFSGHKMYGPMGVGVLYGKKELLNKMTPFLMGGDTIKYVYEQDTDFADIPNKFEAGTQNVGGVIGLGKAVDFINEIGYNNICDKEKSLTRYAIKELSKLDFLELYLPKKVIEGAIDNIDNNLHSSVISFNVKGIHPHDVASILDMNNICIRAGNHCAQPLLRYLGIDATCRASIALYNTKSDIDRLVEGLKVVYNKFAKYIK